MELGLPFEPAGTSTSNENTSPFLETPGKISVTIHIVAIGDFTSTKARPERTMIFFNSKPSKSKVLSSIWSMNCEPAGTETETGIFTLCAITVSGIATISSMLRFRMSRLINK